jgi:hypothetical protein
MQRGELRAGDAALAARVFMAPVMFMAIWKGSLAPFDREPFDELGFLETHLDGWLRGMAPPRSLSDLSDRREPVGGRGQIRTISRRIARTMKRDRGRIWAAIPAGVADQSQVRQAPSTGKRRRVK